VNGPPATSAPSGSKVALAVLVGLVVLSPWPFGGVHLRTSQAVALVSLVAALGAFAWDARHRPPGLPYLVALPLVGLWTLAVVQLVPLPDALHHWIAAGSAAVWHPDVPAAAAVLGPGPHPFSLYPDATRRWLALATGTLALAVAAAPALRERRLLLRASAVIVAGAVLVAVYGLVARLAFGDRLFGLWSVPTVTPFGPFVSKNHFAGYVELAALLAVGLATGLADESAHGTGPLSWVESRRSKWVILAWGAAAVLVLAVPVSLSRGGVVSLVAGLVAFVVLRVSSRGPSASGRLAAALAVLLLAAGAVAVLVPAEVRARVLTLAGVTSDQSGAYRLGVWRDTLRLAVSSPIVGVGFGAYAEGLPRFKTGAGHLRIEHAENDHLELLAEGGGLGALLGGAGALAFFLYGFAALRAQERPLARALAAAALAGGVAVCVHSAFDFNLRIPSNALVGASLAAVSLASALRPRAAAAGTPPRPSAGLLLLPATLHVALLTPWSEPLWDPSFLARAAASPPASLRRSSLEADLTVLLHRRPAQAAAWVELAWLRRPRSAGEAPALAHWGTSLDPQHQDLARAARPLLER